MSEQEINKLAKETYELGLHMGEVFVNDKNNSDFMILAIMACIKGIINKPKGNYTLMPVAEFNGDYFMKLRKEKGYTLRQTEDATGISNSYLSQFENGKIKKPSHHVIKTLLDWYNDGISVNKNDLESYNLKDQPPCTP